MGHADLEAGMLSRLTIIDAALRRERIPYLVHAGAAAYLYGLHDTLDDIDIRVHSSDLLLLRGILADAFQEEIRVRPFVYDDERTYLNYALIVPGEPRLDVTSEMIAMRDAWVFRFPYCPELFASADHRELLGLSIPVTDLNNLCLYYLVLRRSPPRFNDDIAVRRILEHADFNLADFTRMVGSLYYADRILPILAEKMKAIVSK